MSLTPEEFHSYSVEQRQIRQIWDDLNQIAETSSPGQKLKNYLFKDPSPRTPHPGIINIYYDPINGPIGDEELSLGLVDENVEGVDQLVGPVYEIEAALHPNVQSRFVSPWGIVPGYFIDSNSNLFIIGNSYLFDANNQAFKCIYVGNQGREGVSLEDQIKRSVGEEYIDKIPHLNFEAEDIFRLVAISGSDLEEVSRLLALIKSGAIAYQPKTQ